MSLTRLTMTESNIPNGVSFKDLQNALKDAPAEEVDTHKKHLTFKELNDIAADAKSDLFKRTHNPLALKLIALMILSDMAVWHVHISQELREIGEIEAADDWLMDAGQMNLLKNSLLDIEITDQDPTPSWKMPEDLNS